MKSIFSQSRHGFLNRNKSSPFGGTSSPGGAPTACAAFVISLFFAGCASGPSARINQDPELFASFPAEVRENVRAGEIELGYTPEMVDMALGAPDRITTRESADGTERVWIYTRSRSRVGFSLGTGFASGSGSRTTGVGAGVGTRPSRAEETMRVVFSEGEVSAIERRD